MIYRIFIINLLDVVFILYIYCVNLEDFTKECKAGKVYVTAFPDRTEFKKHVADIAWETEVWIAENPDHMIHFNGDRFIGPR